MPQNIIRTVLLLNALIALTSCTGLCINLVSFFKLSTASFNATLLDDFSWQCWTWTVTFILSILAAFVMSTLLLYCQLTRYKHIITFTPLVTFFVTLITCIIFDDKTPSADIRLQDRQNTSPGGWLFHCSLYGDEHESALYHRCVLVDIVWLSGMLICFLWLALFCVIKTSSSPFPSTPSSSIRSTAQSSIQFYKYYLPETVSNLERESYASHRPSTSNDTYLNSKDDISMNQPNVVMFASSKSLPPLNLRSSEETLYLPTHSNISTTYTPCYDKDDLLPCAPLQPQEEKIQVSDDWRETFAPSFTTKLRGSDSDLNYANVHSMDLGWMKRTSQHKVDEDECGWISPYSRRDINTRSFPVLNNKNIPVTLTTKDTTDDTLLRY